MPASSQSQQRLMGMVHAYQKGKLKHPPAKIKEVAKHISKKDATDFARTSHHDLPERVEKTAMLLAGLQKALTEADVPAAEMPALLKEAADNYNREMWGNTLLEKFALAGMGGGLSMQPRGLPEIGGQKTPNATDKEVSQAVGGIQPTFNAANLPGHQSRYNFKDDPDIHQMLARQKERLDKRKAELQKEQDKQLLGVQAGQSVQSQQPNQQQPQPQQ